MIKEKNWANILVDLIVKLTLIKVNCVESTEQRKVTNPRVRGLLLEKIVVFELTKKRSQVNCADKIGISKLGKKG